MNNKIGSIIPIVKNIQKMFYRKVSKGIIENPVVIVLPYEDKFHRKVCYRINGHIVKTIFQYNPSDKKWYCID